MYPIPENHLDHRTQFSRTGEGGSLQEVSISRVTNSRILRNLPVSKKCPLKMKMTMGQNLDWEAGHLTPHFSPTPFFAYSWTYSLSGPSCLCYELIQVTFLLAIGFNVSLSAPCISISQSPLPSRNWPLSWHQYPHEEWDLVYKVRAQQKWVA